MAEIKAFLRNEGRFICEEYFNNQKSIQVSKKSILFTKNYIIIIRKIPNIKYNNSKALERGTTMLRKWAKFNLYVFALPMAFLISLLFEPNGNLLRLTQDTIKEL